MTLPAAPGVVRVAAVHCDGSGRMCQACELLDEAPLIIDVEGVGRYTLMWTPAGEAGPADGPVHEQASGFTPADGWLGEGGPCPALELAAGFAYSEGLFDRLDEIVSLARCPHAPDVVRLALTPAARERAHPALRTVHSGCGVCGGDHLPDAGEASGTADPAALRPQPVLALDTLHRLVGEMQTRQELWQRTGAAHAALLFDATGAVLAFAEDLGRHNALDRAIGQCLLAGRPLSGGGVILSSRCSHEMLAKAVRAGLVLVAAVSAPSSLAVRTAHAQGITLCGFVRDGRATLYTHPGRIGYGRDPSRVQARSASSAARTESGRAPLSAW